MSDDKQYHAVLTAIANELAEANRLKRLELREKYKNSEWMPEMQGDRA